jgi:hypothetical protein
MTGASSLAFPGSRTLAGWWRQFTVHQPEFFWVGYLFLHHIEALASSTKVQVLDRLSVLVLQAVALESSRQENVPTPGSLLGRLEKRLHLHRQVIVQLLRGLTTEGLLTAQAADSWALTDLGKQSLPKGEYPRERWERRVFPFVERQDPSGARMSPHCLPVPAGRGVPWHPGDDSAFDVDLLQEAVKQSDAWKQRYGFPRDVHNISSFSSASREPVAWQHVVLDHPERLLVALVRSSTGLLGFAARQEGWALHSAEPLFSLQSGWESVFPTFERDLSTTALSAAWYSWCKTRGLETTSDTIFELVGPRLRVRVSQTTLKGWKARPADLFKGDTWLLLGDGLVRPAVLLDVIS